jgi:glycosyltransferase 2 family protein
MKNVKLFLILILSLVLVFLFLRTVDFSGIPTVLKSVNPLYPLLFFLSGIGQYLLRALRWRVLLAPSKRYIPLRSLFNFTVIGFMISFILPGRIGEIARPVMLAEKEKIKKSHAIATIINERLLDLLTVVLLFILALNIIPPDQTILLGKMRRISFIALPAILGVFVLFFLLNRPAVFSRIETILVFSCRILPARFRHQTSQALLSFLQGLKMELPIGGYLQLAGWSLFLWVYSIFFYWVLMRGFVEPAMLRITPVETTFFFALIFISAAIPTPGMAGSFDLAARLGLTTLFAVSQKTADAYILLAHFFIIITPLALGSLALYQEGLKFGKVRRIATENDLPAVS